MWYQWLYYFRMFYWLEKLTSSETFCIRFSIFLYLVFFEDNWFIFMLRPHRFRWDSVEPCWNPLTQQTMGQACLSLQQFWGALLCKILTYALCTCFTTYALSFKSLGLVFIYFLIEGIKLHIVKHGQSPNIPLSSQPIYCTA